MHCRRVLFFRLRNVGEESHFGKVVGFRESQWVQTACGWVVVAVVGEESLGVYVRARARVCMCVCVRV